MITIAINDMDELKAQTLACLIDTVEDFTLVCQPETIDGKRIPAKDSGKPIDVLLHKFDERRPDCELAMLEELQATKQFAHVLALLDSEDPLLRKRLLELGNISIAHSCLRKNELVALIRSSAAGYTSAPRQTTLSRSLGKLSFEENAMVRLACKGYSRKELANEMALSESSIKRSISHILSITGYETLGKLAIAAIGAKAVNPYLEMKYESSTAKPHEQGIRYYHACGR